MDSGVLWIIGSMVVTLIGVGVLELFEPKFGKKIERFEEVIFKPFDKIIDKLGFESDSDK